MVVSAKQQQLPDRLGETAQADKCLIHYTYLFTTSLANGMTGNAPQGFELIISVFFLSFIYQPNLSPL